MVTSLSHLNYEERLQVHTYVHNLPTLHYRRHRVYNILHGRYNIDFPDFFTFHIIFIKLEGIHLSCVNIIQQQTFGKNFYQKSY